MGGTPEVMYPDWMLIAPGLYVMPPTDCRQGAVNWLLRVVKRWQKHIGVYKDTSAGDSGSCISRYTTAWQSLGDSPTIAFP